MSEYWNTQTAGFTHGIGNIATAIAMQPRMRAAAAQRQAQMAEMAARTGLLNTQNDDLQGRMSGTQSLADEAQGAMTVDAQGRITFDPNKAPNLVSALIRSSKGGNDASMSIANFTKGQNAPVEADLTREGNLTRALQVAQIGADERANRPMIIPNGGTMATPEGDLLAEGGANVPSGSIRLEAMPNTDLAAGIIPRTIANNPKTTTGKTAQDPEMNRIIANTLLANNKDANGKLTNSVGNMATLYKKAKADAITSEPKTFDDENSARQSGLGAGDIIYIKGVGKVRLK